MTEHLALYRKYRPHTFKEVLGQDHIVKVLEGALKQKNISHAYLFAGSRGTGKTSIARILAHELGTTNKDLYEIDAASNRGIDDIRELREGVSVLPFESPYKVYIIDEVHMLTKEAFNALLKTLEEPPPHVLFMLATTELEKLPETIVSRCQTFSFKKPSTDVLKQMITDVAKKEKVTLAPASADLIALLADGSFRDAHGILQKIIALSKDKKVSVEEVELVTGAPRGSLVNEVIGALSDGKLESALSAVRSAVEHNIDMRVFLKLLLQKIRSILLLRHAPDLKDMIEEQYAKEDLEFLKKVAAEKESVVNAEALKILLDAYTDTDKAYIPQLPLELALISLIGQDTEA
jgi:DNA polymerase-3 subunit gamma/tau